MKKFNGTLILAGTLLAGGYSDAFATLQLRLSDGTVPGTVLLVDNDSNDSRAEVGIISYVGPVGANWIVNVTTGLSKPVLGSALVPIMDLGTLNLSQGAGTLTIELTDTDFVPNGDAQLNIGGTTDGSVTIRTWADGSNTPFGHGALVASLGPFGGGAFNGGTTGTVAVNSPYSLTLEAVIQHAGPGSSGFNDELIITPFPEARGGCRVTGGSNHQTNTWQSACITTELPTHISHGGQVGAPFSVATPFTPNSECIRGEWEHNRHLKGNSLVGVLHASGNGHEHQFDSLLCACLPCPENPGAEGVVGDVCNPGDRTCGPLPRTARANKICFSGVADYTFTTGNKTVKAVFRVDIEDRSEGNSHSSTEPLDRYRIRIWILDPSCGRDPDPNSAANMAIRFAASADPAQIGNLATTENLKVNIAPDIDDGGNMTQGNHQIHPQTGAQCDAVAVLAGAHVDTSTEVAAKTQAGLSAFGISALGLQGSQDPSFVYRTTITNVGWINLNNLSVITGAGGPAVDATSSYFAPGAVLPPGGTITRYYTNTWSEDTILSVLVSGVGADGTPAFSSSSTIATVALAPPTGLSAKVNGKKVTVSWSALAGASSYNIKRSTTSGGPYTTIKTQTGTSYSQNPGKGTYYYVVSGVKSGAETLNSAQVSATVK
jgi:hypothetical protein